jgi:hypothetical protein
MIHNQQARLDFGGKFGQLECRGVLFGRKSLETSRKIRERGQAFLDGSTHRIRGRRLVA